MGFPFINIEVYVLEDLPSANLNCKVGYFKKQLNHHHFSLYD